MNWQLEKAGNLNRATSRGLLAGVMMVALALSGCGGDNKTGGLTVDTAPAKSATVNFSVAFPQADASKSIIPSYTAGIGIGYCQLLPPENWCDLFGPEATGITVTRDNPTATILLVPGHYKFGALVSTSADLSDMTSVFDLATTEGEIIAGANTVRMTFLQGDWTFKTAAGANDPVTLGDGTVFSGFKLRMVPEMMGPTTADVRKATFDYQQPVGIAAYTATMNTSAGALEGAWLEVFSQFHSGTDNTNGIIGMEYNLTQGCALNDYNGVCSESEGDWGVFMINAVIEAAPDQYEDYGPYALLPDETLNDASGNPVDLTGRDSYASDGVTIVAQLVDYQLGASADSLVIVGAAAAKSMATTARSREQAVSEAVAAVVGEASKSVTTTNVGTIVSDWYEPVIASNGTGTNKGTWNFDDWVYNPDTQQFEQVVDGCLVTGDPSGRNYATCGYLDDYNPATGQFGYDMGDYSWGLAPTDPQNLGEYSCMPLTAGYYEPWCFWDENSDGAINTGSFQFSHYLKTEQTINNARFHRVTAKGVALPEGELNPPPM